MRSDVRESFSQSVSGTDLIVGARTGAVQLMLYAVFRVGGATNNVRMDEPARRSPSTARSPGWCRSRSAIRTAAARCWAPRPAYFEHFRYGDQQPLVLAQGRAFAATSTTCTTRCSAPRSRERLGYRLGEKHHAQPWRRRDPRRRPCRQALHRGRHPGSAPARRWTARCTSAWRRWRRSTSTGSAGAPMPGMKIAPEQARAARPAAQGR